jgi:hypothetical protein
VKDLVRQNGFDTLWNTQLMKTNERICIVPGLSQTQQIDATITAEFNDVLELVEQRPNVQTFETYSRPISTHVGRM